MSLINVKMAMIATILLEFMFLLATSELTNGLRTFPQVMNQIDEVPTDVREKLNSIPDEHYHRAANLGVDSVNHDDNLECQLRTRGITVEKNSDSYAQMLESMPNENSQKLDRLARKIAKSNSYFINRHCLPENIDSHTCGQFLSSKPLPSNSDIKRSCLSIKDRNEYAFTRLLPPRYEDGIYQMIKDPRPSIITQDKGHPNDASRTHPNYNLLVMQWAQFIEHDLSKPVSTTMSNGDPIECCTLDNYKLAPRYVHPACAPLEGIDPQSEYSHISCQNYVRNAQTINSECTFGPPIMLNEENGKLDLSQLYGFWPTAQNRMRAFKDGLLKSSKSSQIKTSMLPLTNDTDEFCISSNLRDCYMAGDSRVNSNPFTTQLYTIFLRSHNIIAKNLKAKHPAYTDQKIFDLAKERNIAEYVFIVFEEWLPAAFGDRLVQLIREDDTQGSRGISSEFGVAAIRFYYSMMPDKVHLYEHGSSKYTPNLILSVETVFRRVLNAHNRTSLVGLSYSRFITGTLDISKHFYNSDFLNSDSELNSLLQGMINTNALTPDIYYKSIALQNCLKSKDQQSGFDCLALDIQRGRDHGLASYRKYLEHCSGVQIQNWSAMEAYIDARELDSLKKLYASVDDIDLLVGALSERPVNGFFGVTISCIIADQFAKIWKEIGPQIHFDEDSAISNQLLCRTTGLTTMPRNVFNVASERNKFINCSEIRTI